MNLFQWGLFTLRSGKTSNWKLECDGITADEWGALAAMAAEILPPFSVVSGVPRGGDPFAMSLATYRTEDAGTMLIAEDVCTTGGSMERWRAGLTIRESKVIGVCVFAREPVWPDWVFPLFAFNPMRRTG